MKPGEIPSAQQIREARERAKLTQTQAAELIYVHRQTWNRYESGELAMPPVAWELWQIKSTIIRRTEAGAKT